jgi:hypothetical protein
MKTYSIIVRIKDYDLPKPSLTSIPYLNGDRLAALQGVECLFVKLNSKVGIKIYYSLKEARQARERQLLAHKHELGPEVLSEVHQCYIKNLIREIDTYCGDFLTKYSNFPRDYGYFYKTEVVKVNYGNYKHIKASELSDLQQRLRNIGLRDNDLHYNNLGRKGRQLVYLDFGNESN